jgi:hypothetical protein
MADRFAVYASQDDGPATFYPVCRAILGLVFAGKESGIGSPSRPLVFPVIPKSAKVVINTYRQPDAWELTFDARDLPIDPQSIRLGSVEISMYETNGIEAEKRLLSRQFAESEDGAAFSRRTYLEVTRAQAEQAAMTASERKNVALEARRTYFEDSEPLIAGIFDEDTISLSTDGRWVALSGQDMTSLVMGHQWHPVSGGRARRIPTGKRADDWAASILAEIDPNGVLSVTVQGMADEELPTIGKSEISMHGRGIPIESNTTYWDVLYKVLTRHGLLCYFRGFELVLTRPRSVAEIQRDIRYLAWGANLESITLSRRLGAQKAPKIILQCVTEDDSFVITEPPGGPGPKETIANAHKQAAKTRSTQKIKAEPAKAAKRPSKKIPTITKDEEYQIHSVHGVSDRKLLQEYARTLRYLAGRGERKITACTHHLRDLLGRPLLDLDVGDPVDIDWRDFDRTTLGAMSPERRYQQLVDIGYQEEVAQVLAESYELLVATQRPLRISQVAYDWEADGGLAIDMQALDFVTDTIPGQNDPAFQHHGSAKLLGALGSK